MIGNVEAPCGSWKSKITAEMVVDGNVRLNHIRTANGKIYWEEMNPSEKGRVLLVTLSEDGKEKKLLPAPYSARTKINEYGGCSYCVAGEKIFFVNGEDQRIYRIDEKQKIAPITKPGNVRYGNLLFDAKRDRLLCVQEELGEEVVHTLVAIDLSGKKETLAQGADFYGSLALSPDGSSLACLYWDHPNMPWDAAQLMLGELTERGALINVRKIAGGRGNSIFQPSFGPDGRLFFVWEKTGFWNLYSYREKKIDSLFPLKAEFGVPEWIGGLSTYAFVPKEKGYQILCSYIQKGVGHLGLLDPESHFLREIQTPYLHFVSMAAGEEKAFFIASSSKEFPSIVQMDLKQESFEVIKKSKELTVDFSEISLPEEICFPTTNKEMAYGFYYPPKNASYQPLKGEKPPLIVLAHGGPTSQVFPSLSLSHQYWTNRGFGVVDVNYRGSTGYGRSFREKLLGHMLYNVEDCIAAADDLVKKGKVDEKRLIIKGGSAGGYAVLAALAFYHTFQVGVSYYGVSDLETLVQQTHKFEAHYLDRLVGPYPQAREDYLRLSPIHSVDKISAPILFFQGSADKIVPPDQSERMYEAIKKRGIPTAYLLFDLEQHGFYSSQNLKRCLEAEEYFYSEILGHELPEKISPIPIANLPH